MAVMNELFCNGKGLFGSVLLSVLAGMLLFWAATLLSDHQRTASSKPASTAYGVF